MSTGNAAGSLERARERVRGTGIGSGYGAVTVALWGLVVGLYAVGDTGLTTVVLELGGFEANPVGRAFFEVAGYAGLVVQKALAVGILWTIWRYYPTVGDFSPDPWRLIVPAIAAFRGGQLVVLHVQHISVLV